MTANSNIQEVLLSQGLHPTLDKTNFFLNLDLPLTDVSKQVNKTALELQAGTLPGLTFVVLWESCLLTAPATELVNKL